MELLTDDIVMGESPRWHDGRLWVSDWGRGLLLVVSADGKTEVAATGKGAFCFDFLPDGRLLVVTEGRLLAGEPFGPLEPYADLSGLGVSYWNDIVVDGRGNAYVGALGFDFGSGASFAPGAVALVRPSGEAVRVADGVAFPNGIAVSADNGTLILAESYGKCLTGWDIAADGTLSGQRVWAALGDGVPDGICVDATGAVWYADVPNKCCVRVAEGGAVLDTVTLDRGAFACMLGGSTLYVVANQWGGVGNTGDGRVFMTPAPAPLAGWPGS
ncbi:MAG TPA: SMP-30/gluconolactonase/LRE family protein [Mycobacteriales bacterium]|jgi:sugar lactone lactonase YvrE|nr:SMP-30/gluconolactonase/LRE family protein [Mycobacteriales bacterium]